MEQHPPEGFPSALESTPCSQQRVSLPDIVAARPDTPVFVPGGPPRAPFDGPGHPSWTNPAYALHHARSWDSALALGAMPPLKGAAAPEGGAGARFLARLGESLAELAGSPLPHVAQVWGPMTMASTHVGTEAYLASLRNPAEALALTDAGLETALVSVRVVLRSRPTVLWIAEPLAAIVDPGALQLLWPHTMRRLMAEARAVGAEPVVHVSGSAAHVLPIAARLGVAGVSITADTPLATARKLLPAHAVVFGNLDSMRLLDRDEEWLSAAARRMVEEMRGRPFVLTPGSAIPPHTSVERLAAFVDAVRG